MNTFDCPPGSRSRGCSVPVHNIEPQEVTRLRWPDYYAPPGREMIEPLPWSQRAAQKRWQGVDLHEELPARWRRPASPRGEPAMHDYFDLVTSELAGRSFNGREVRGGQHSHRRG